MITKQIRGGKVIRQGNSLMITIPAEIVKEQSIREGDRIIILQAGELLFLSKDRPGRDPLISNGTPYIFNTAGNKLCSLVFAKDKDFLERIQSIIGNWKE